MSDGIAGLVSRQVVALGSSERAGRFLAVGLVGFGVDTGTVLALTSQLGVYRGSAKLVGAELAIVVMFLLNENWTFADHGAAGRLAFVNRLAKSNLVRMGGVAVATVLFVVISGLDVRLPVGGEALWLTVSNAIGIAAGFLVNYTAETLFTWRVART